MFRLLKIAVFVCCLALTGSSPVAAAGVTIDMTGRITRDCLVNNGFGFRFRYSHADQLCHTTEPTVSGDFGEANQTWTPICKESPTDNRCPWPAGNCCVYCGFRGTTHTQEGKKGKGMAPGTYRLNASASPYVESGTPLDLSFGFTWTPSGDVNDIRGCAGDGAGILLQPSQSWAVTLIIPDMGQTTRLEKLDGDSQKTLQGGALSRPLRVKASGIDNTSSPGVKQGLTIQWTVKDPNGAVFSQFGSLTDNEGISAVAVTLGGASGVYIITAACSECIANKEVAFSASVLTTEEARALTKLYGDGSGPVGSRLDNPLSVRVINTVTGDPEPGIDVNFEPATPNSCSGFSANPNFTATDGKGVARAFVSLPQQPGACTYKASCATCLGNKEVLFSVEATPKPELDVSGGGGGDKRSGGGPSPAGGRGDDGPLVMQYGRAGFFVYTSPPAPAGFVGVLTGDQAQFKAVPPAGSLEWTRDGAVFTSGPEATATFNQARLIDNPAAILVRRADDGKAETVNVIVEERPTGFGDKGAYAQSALELCSNPLDFETYAKCKIMLPSEVQANAWAEKQFEPGGRSLTEQQGYSCRNNCCDAAKHAFWHAVITKFVGLSYSQRHGIAHEVSGLAEGESNATVMDLHNNRIGQAVGLASNQTSFDAIGFEVLTRIRGGQALVLYNPRNNGKASLLERSYQCAK